MKKTFTTKDIMLKTNLARCQINSIIKKLGFKAKERFRTKLNEEQYNQVLQECNKIHSKRFTKQTEKFYKDLEKKNDKEHIKKETKKFCDAIKNDKIKEYIKKNLSKKETVKEIKQKQKEKDLQNMYNEIDNENKSKIICKEKSKFDDFMKNYKKVLQIEVFFPCKLKNKK